MHFGELELRIVSGGRLALDGGNMFGVVPKVLWENTAPPTIATGSPWTPTAC